MIRIRASTRLPLKGLCFKVFYKGLSLMRGR